MSTAGDDVLVQHHHGTGHLTLNRPETLNVLTGDMVATLRDCLTRWVDDDDVRVIVIDGAGEHGLSAGGDLRALHEDARRGGGASIELWADECRLAVQIARCPKPVVALMDGMVMGSGIGIAAHASHRVVSEDSIVAMPEVAIGLVPMLGGTRLLAQAPGELGTHLALTADRMDAADALYCGLADWYVPQEQRSALFAALAESHADDALSRLSVSLPYESELRSRRPWIDDCYSADRVEDVLERLHGSENPEARSAADRIEELSPTVVKVTLRALREARSDPTVEDTVRREFRIATRLLVGHEALEGIRAQAVDRDRVPTWEPDTLQAVGAADVAAYFASLGQRDLDLAVVPGRS